MLGTGRSPDPESARVNDLLAHPSTPLPGFAIRGAASRVASGVLEFGWTIAGALDRLRLPESAPPHPSDDLWRHTCVEAFVRPGEGPGYLELNLAPSQAWAVYRFGAYRERLVPGRPDAAHPGPTAISVRRVGDHVELSARLDVAELLGAPAGPVDVGLSAVLETNGGALAYFALRHPAGRPDFHHADAFALRLEA